MEIGKLRKQITYKKIGQQKYFWDIKYNNFKNIDVYLDTLAQLLESGTKIIQLNGEGISDKEFLEAARKTAQLCAIYSSILIIKSRADIAYLSSADCVNLEQDDLDIESVREIIGENTLMGIYTESQNLKNSIHMDADYLVVRNCHETDAIESIGIQVIAERGYKYNTKTDNPRKQIDN